MVSKNLCRIVVVAGMLLGCAWAQEFRGTITGRVTDPSGAVIAGAKVTAENVATGAKQETVTNPDGQYRIPYLPSGSYHLSVEAAGFKHYLRSGLTVRVEDLLTLDVQMEVGGVTESVTVTSEAPLLETSTASSGQVVDGRRIAELPMNGRVALSLAHLSFGVIPNATPFFQRPFDNSGPSDFSIGGTPRRNNALLVDGVSDTTTDRRVAYNPPADAVTEFKVMTTGFDASYGFTMGGIVNLTTKSGTNTLHGSIYHFHQNSAFHANDWFLNRGGRPKTVSRYNQWGGTAGGPIVFPKLFNGRDRAFWFFAYEGIKDSFPEPVITTVPTEKERRGDFSDLLAVGTRIYNPSTARQSGSAIVRDPFTDNKIPEGTLSPIAKNLLQYLPLPNIAGTADGRNNYLAAASRRDTFDSELVRFDFNITSSHKLSWRTHHNHRIEDRGNRFENIATGNFLLRENWGMAADHVWTITPTLLLNTRLGWTRFDEGNTRPSDGFDIATLGFPAPLAKAATHGVLPRIRIGPFNQIGPDNAGNFNPNDSYNLTTQATKVFGRHSLKFGVNFLLLRDSDFAPGNSAGDFSFDTSWTRQASNVAGATIGQDLAAFLLGLPANTGGFDLNTARTNSSLAQGYFLHDDFRIKPNLTLNLGIRYEILGATSERYNRSVRGFDSTSASPIAAQAEAAYAQLVAAGTLTGVPAFKLRGGLLFAGVGGNPSEIYNTIHNLWSPRFGLAWQPFGRKNLVIRGGYGIHYAPNGVGGNNAFGFNQRTPFSASPDNGLTFTATLANPFPTGLLQPTGSTQGLATFLGQNIRFRAVDQRPPYAQRWELNIQRELPGSILFEVGYIGNHMIRLKVDRALNYVPRAFLSTSPTRDQNTINFLTAPVSNPMRGLIPGSLGGTTVQRSQLLMLYPQFLGVGGPLRQATIDANSSGVVSDNDPAGGSYFHMLQVRVEKRFSKGVTFNANYMYSKLIEHASFLNGDDLAPEKRVAEDDRPQRFVLSALYELPFGYGRRFNPNVPVLKWFISGWQVGAVSSAQTGQPLNWAHDSSNLPIYFGGALNVNNKNPDQAFDVTRFERSSARRPDFSLRTLPSRFGNLRRDGFNNWDMNLVKNNKIRERINIQYRLELFNALNHPSFDRPSTDPYSSAFGTITQTANLPRNIQMALRITF